jgi:hypothetical protein
MGEARKPSKSNAVSEIGFFGIGKFLDYFVFEEIPRMVCQATVIYRFCFLIFYRYNQQHGHLNLSK